MIIHLTGSGKNLKKDIRFYREIIDTIHKADGILALDWVEATYHRQEKGEQKDDDIDWRLIIEDNVKAIKRSDIVIIEATQSSVAIGFQLATALQHKRPTLVVSQKPLNARMFSGLRNKLLKLHEYKNEEQLHEIVRKFIRENTIATKDLRFNMFIDRRIYNYLREESYETGKNKSEIIRELLEREIQRGENQ